MSSGFSGGPPDFFFNGERSNLFPTNTTTTNNNNFNLPQQQFSFRSPLAGILPDPDSQIRRPDLIGKRSLAEFQQQQQQQSFFQQNQQQQQGLGFYLRNVKQRPNYQQQHENPSLSLNPNSVNLRYGRLPVLQHQNLSVPNLGQTKVLVNNTAQETEKRLMSNKLQELEKQLLGDEDEEEEEQTEGISGITNSEWSETIQNLIGEKPILPSPTSSSSSCSSPVLPCPKELLIEAATAVSEGKPDVASEILTRLAQVANVNGNSEQRLCFYMIQALKSRVNAPEFPVKAASELCGKEHEKSIQMLYDVSPCFKLGFMAANLAILEAATEQGFEKIHVLDFDIGQGGQYVHLLHALAARIKGGKNSHNLLRITTFADFTGDNEKLKTIGEGLRVLANKLGVQLSFHVHDHQSAIELTRGSLNVQSDEALAANFAFKLYKLPDESVTLDNLRDELLRSVKSLNPTVMTVVEQEMNGNTAPLVARVRDACEYYGALLESLDATIDRKRPERVDIELGLSRKMCNSVACEGKERVERCEVFGKWRARMGMAGFVASPLSQLVAESLRSKLNSGTRGNPGFGVSEMSGGVGFGWMGRTLTVASAWR